jgi:hypothetical protein
MVTCESSSCKKRFYSYLEINGKYQVELTDYDLKNPDPAVKTKAKAKVMTKQRRDTALAAIAAALSKLEREGETLTECAGDCRCPDIEKPPLGKSPWPDDQDTATYHTSFSIGGSTYVVWFTVKQKFVDIERGCVLKDKEISFLVPDDPIAELLDRFVDYTFGPREVVMIEPGVTRIGEVYDIGNGPRVLLACQDRRNAIIHVAPDAREAVRHLLKAREDSNGKWLIVDARERTEYTVVPIEHLDLDQPIETGGSVFVTKDADCLAWKKDECRNMIDPKTNKFVYSRKTTVDTWVCTRTSGKDCKEVPQELEIEVYDKKDCAGVAKKKTVTILLCSGP